LQQNETTALPADNLEVAPRRPQRAARPLPHARHRAHPAQVAAPAKAPRQEIEPLLDQIDWFRPPEQRGQVRPHAAARPHVTRRQSDHSLNHSAAFLNAQACQRVI